MIIAKAGGSSLPVVDETAIVYETGIPANTLTFDVTPFTAARTWTWPDATTTVAGLGVAQTFTEAIGFYGSGPVAQPAAVADATGAGDVVAQLNALLARIRSLGLIAT